MHHLHDALFSKVRASDFSFIISICWYILLISLITIEKAQSPDTKVFSFPNSIKIKQQIKNEERVLYPKTVLQIALAFNNHVTSKKATTNVKLPFAIRISLTQAR